jgi:hypothetical protein
MSLVTDARTRLVESLRTVPDLRVYDEPSARIGPPAAVVSLPDLRWQNVCAEPTVAVFEVAVVAALNERAIDVLSGLVLQVTAAVDAVASAAVLQARAGTWNDQLPAYLVEIEMEL